MGRKKKLIICILLIIAMVLPGSFHGESTVRAENASESLYQWRRVNKLDELKKYIDADGNETDYKGKWVPIIIVAEYADGTQYYLNRKTSLTIRSGEVGYIPSMNSVANYDLVGAVLKNGMKSGDEFVSKGDLGAMHMYYHGKQTSTIKDKGPQKVTNITSDVWSLTKDDVADYSDRKPDTVYGLQAHDETSAGWNYRALDQNNVEEWEGTSGIPKTYSPLDDDRYYFKQGWTFFDDNRAGYFLICNMFGKPINIGDGYADYEVPTWGCALGGRSRFSDPDEKKRYLIETPSRAAAAMDADYVSDKKGNEKRDIVADDALREKILEQYEYKYDEEATRVRFKIYIGKKIEGNSILKDDIIANRTDTMGTGNTIPEGVKLTVKKGATMIIPEGSWLLLDGTIENEGTIIVENNAVIGSTIRGEDCREIGGTILCQNGGQLLVMENAHVYLSNKLLLQNNGQVINKGIIAVAKVFSMKESQIQLANQGRLAVGFAFDSPSILYAQDFSGTFKERFYKNVYNYSGNCYQGRNCQFVFDQKSKIILEKTSAVDTSYDTYEIYGVPRNLISGIDDGVEQRSLLPKEIKTQRQASSFVYDKGHYMEYVYQ